MANPANSTVQNLLPVQAYFNEDKSFNTFIGQGIPFYATANPIQSGLSITNSTINSTTIGAITPSTGVFSSGQVIATPVGSTDLANKLYVDSVAAGLSWKQPVAIATLTNITLSGLQTIDGYTTLAGDRVLVKNQSTAANNGIYIAASGAWARSEDANTWNELIGAITFIEYGTQASSAYYCSAQPGGTLGVTAVNWSNFSVSATYTAGTGLTLVGFQFNIANTGATAGTYGTAARTITQTVNAQGQITNIFDQPIAIANTQVSGLGTMSTQAASAVAITGGTIDGVTIGGTTAGAVTATTFTGAGTGLTGTASSLSIGGTAALATYLAGGAAGSFPYQSGANVTSFLAAGTNGQVLTLSSGVPAWTNASAGTVTSVSGTGTVSGITLTGTVTSSGSLTLGGTLDLSSPPVIGGTTPNTINGSTITANTKFVSTDFYAQSITGGNLRTSGGTSLLNWDGGGSGNITVNGGLTANPSNKNISLSPTGTGTVAISPAGALTINPTTASAMDNVVIGGTTPLAGTFTTLRVNSTISLAGSTGTSGYVLTSNGASAPTWQVIPTAAITVADDTTTNATRYLTFTSATSGTISTINTGSTKISINPFTGLLSLISATMAGTTSAYGFKTPNIAEPTTVSATAATGTINYDVTTQSVLYYTTNASANWTVNFRGSSGTSLNTLMVTNDSIAVTFMVTQGSTAYYNSAVTIDGNSVTPKWQGGSAPTSGNASGIDVYNYVITKTASATYTILASISQFK
jgi:hypothetical protein